MTLMNSKPQWYWAISVAFVFLLSFAMRWSYINTAEVINPVRGDAAQYYKYAWNLANYSIFSGAPIQEARDSSPQPDSYRDPGYPLFMAVILKTTPTPDAWYITILILQAFLSSFVVVLTMLIGSYWLPKKWALIAGVFSAAWPHSVVFSGYLLTETLVAFFCSLSLWLLIRAHKKEKLFLAVLSGLAISAAALTNAILLPFSFVLATIGSIVMSKQRKLWLIFFISASLLPGVWTVRNAQLDSTVASSNSSTYRAYQNLVQGSWPTYHKAYKGMFMGDEPSKEIIKEIHKEIDLLAEDTDEGVAAITKRLSSDPLKYFSWYLLKKPILLWDWEIGIGQGDIYVYPTVNSPLNDHTLWRLHTSTMRGLQPFIIALMFAAMFMVAYKKEAVLNEQNIALLSTLVLTVYVTGIYTVFQSEPRYSIPFRSFGILLAITSTYYIVTFAQHKRKKKNE